MSAAGSLVVCGADGISRIVRRDATLGRSYWIVVAAEDRGALSGGFIDRRDAIAEARRLGSVEGSL